MLTVVCSHSPLQGFAALHIFKLALNAASGSEQTLAPGSAIYYSVKYLNSDGTVGLTYKMYGNI